MAQNFPSHLASSIQNILSLILVSFVLILIRLWQLTVIQQEIYIDLAVAPKTKTVIERAKRGEIVDREGIPLASNRLCYQAHIYYGEILQISPIRWIPGPGGKKIKTYPRKEYVSKLCKVLGKELHLDSERLEDVLYSHAALFPHLPYVIKDHLSEKEYYRLKLLEKDWPGIQGESAEKRWYPQGRLACDVLGYMGALNHQEYVQVAGKIKKLKQILENPEIPLPSGYNSLEQVVLQLRQLKERSYTLQDWIGKSGLEAVYEKDLRGFFGMTHFAVNPQGNFLHKLPNRKPPIPGKKIVLSLSAPLQRKAESLLAKQEKEAATTPSKQKMPWIKGGSILALDPKTGEILAFASYPRYDPNDFLPASKEEEKKTSQIHQWLESPQHIAEVWEGKKALTREFYDEEKEEFYEDKLELSWDTYLTFLFPPESPFLSFFSSFTVRQAIELQEDWEKLAFHYPEKEASSLMQQFLVPSSFPEKEGAALQKKWLPYLAPFTHPKDALLVIDLCRLAIHSPAFSDALIQKIGSLSLSHYFSLGQQILQLQEKLRLQAKKAYHEVLFPQWRKENQATYLQKKRAEETQKHHYARPFLDYLDQKEKKLFHAFWKNYQLDLLVSYLKDIPLPKEASFLTSYLPKDFTGSLKEWSAPLDKAFLFCFLKTVRPFHKLTRPLLTHYPYFSSKKTLLEKDLASSFYPAQKFGYGRSYAYRQACPLGSLFKLLTAYCALQDHYSKKEEPFSFSMIDQYRYDARVKPKGGYVVGYTEEGTPIPRLYQGGRLPKSFHKNLGKIDLVSAIECSSNPYFSLLARSLPDPNQLKKTAQAFGFGQKTGIDLPGEIAGNLPHDLSFSPSGLYAFAIGQHTLAVTPLQTALMLSGLANGGKILKPRIAKATLGKERLLQAPFFPNKNNPYQKYFQLLGIPFSLFAYPEEEEKLATLLPYERKHTVPMLDKVHHLLFEGMDRVVWGEKGTARPSIIRSLLKNPSLMKKFKSYEHSFIGKTSTAEVKIRNNINPSAPLQTYNHVWFGCISFEEEKNHRWSAPELVVVVYLQYAKSGKEGAPLAMEMIETYRQLQRDKKASSSSGCL